MEVEIFGGSAYSTGPRSIPEKMGWWTGYSFAANKHATQSKWEFEPWQRWMDGTYSPFRAEAL